jgi:hypothetical protein
LNGFSILFFETTKKQSPRKVQVALFPKIQSKAKERKKKEKSLEIFMKNLFILKLMLLGNSSRKKISRSKLFSIFFAQSFSTRKKSKKENFFVIVNSFKKFISVFSFSISTQFGPKSC